MFDKISSQKLIYTEENDDEESVTTFDDSSQTSGEDYFYEFLESYNSEPIYTELRPLHPSFISDIPNSCDNPNYNPNYAPTNVSDNCDSLDSIPPLEPVSFTEESSENDLFQGNNAKLSSLILPLYEPNSSLFLNLVKKSLHDLKNNKNPDPLNIDESKSEHLKSSMSSESYSPSTNNTEKLTDWNDMEELDTKGIAEKVTSELRRLNVSQLHFAQKVLGRSQGTLSDLLRNPRPWTKMKSGRETFGRMLKWLQESDAERLSILTPSSKSSSQSKSTPK